MAHSISTHVLDTERGEPAQGVPVTLSRLEGVRTVNVSAAETNGDGRIPRMMDGPLRAGRYRLTFDVAAYFRKQGRDVPFLRRVQIEFQIADTERHYHVPLLLSPYSCTSYRGS
jgi:5-hydroxyisourate hydrolase